jgi:hypothetical protein
MAKSFGARVYDVTCCKYHAHDPVSQIKRKSIEETAATVSLTIEAVKLRALSVKSDVEVM